MKGIPKMLYYLPRVSRRQIPRNFQMTMQILGVYIKDEVGVIIIQSFH